MTEQNERRPETARRGSGDGRRAAETAGKRGGRRGTPEMSLHDADGRARSRRGERYGGEGAGYAGSRADMESGRRYAGRDSDARGRIREDRGPAADRRRAGDRGRRRRRRTGRRVVIALILMAAVAALLFAGARVAGQVLDRVMDRFVPQAREEHYPVQYEEFIRAYAAENEIPPAYVAAVILTESSYNPQAVSHADARGLMQILPSTAEWIAGRLGEEFSEELLFDPETNIRYGSWYLGFLMKRYDGDMTCATAAYHAGQGTVDGWLGDIQYSEDGETLAVIASDATSTYVSRVLRRYERYAEIYQAEP